MAKTEKAVPADKANKVENFSKEKQGAGWKVCPECKGYTKGPRSPKCLGCGYDFPATKGKADKAKSAFKGGNQKATTGIKATLPILDKVRSFIASQGGEDGAKKAIDDFNTLVNECGSIEDVKEAISTLAKWEKEKA